MSMRDWAKKLKALEARKYNLRRKIACIGGHSASKLWWELDKIEGKISRIRNVARQSSTAAT